MSGAFSGDNVQVGVAADAFYEKATALPNLLKVIDHLSNNRAPHLRTSSALWIQHDANGSEPSEITISCSECFRTFSHVVAAVGCAHVHELRCLYCCSSIQVAIVRSSNAATTSVPA
jgi:hypothetical protein